MLTLECELTGLDCPWRSQRRLGVERPEGLEHGDPRRARCLLIMGVLSWEH